MSSCCRWTNEKHSCSQAWIFCPRNGLLLLVEYLPPLPVSSASVVSPILGVFCSSSADSMPSASNPVSREPGALKFSIVRFRTSPPFAVRFSTISGGGGSSLQWYLISYALLPGQMLSDGLVACASWSCSREVFVVDGFQLESHGGFVMMSEAEFLRQLPPSHSFG
jgi:hypothetical protein